jgi:hypothetical protein
MMKWYASHCKQVQTQSPLLSPTNCRSPKEFGSGSANHGEQNVVEAGKDGGIDLGGGSMFTYTRAGGFIGPCGGDNNSGCKKLFVQYGWKDTHLAINAAYKAMGSPIPPAPSAAHTSSVVRVMVMLG